MRWFTTIAAVLACSLSATQGWADSLTPIVPHDIGHWINIEYRAGTLAAEISQNRPLVEAILVVERSLPKVDSLILGRRASSACIDLSLPYIRVRQESVVEEADDGIPAQHLRAVRYREVMRVRVCSTDQLRAIMWRQDGSLYIMTRPRNDFGGFAVTHYLVQQVTADELDRVEALNTRRVARNRELRSPRVRTLYAPPLLGARPRLDDPFLASFSAEFGITVPRGDLSAEGYPASPSSLGDLR